MVEFPEQRLPSYSVSVTSVSWLSPSAFQLTLEKPDSFIFRAGQKVLLEALGIQREYSLACAPEDGELNLYIRHVENGALSAHLATLTAGSRVNISEPYGFFLYRPGRAVLIATGTGIAPYVAFARDKFRAHMLLHGVRREQDLHYQELLRKSVDHYLPCISGGVSGKSQEADCYPGRVTEFLDKKMPEGLYDFYLCGNGAMIRDATIIIDQKFSESRVFTETFFTGLK